MAPGGLDPSHVASPQVVANSITVPPYEGGIQGGSSLASRRSRVRPPLPPLHKGGSLQAFTGHSCALGLGVTGHTPKIRVGQKEFGGIAGEICGKADSRNMIRAGVPQTVAMSITGHRTDSMFRRYNVVSTVDQADALRRQFNYLKGQPSEPSNVAEFARETDKTRTSE